MGSTNSNILPASTGLTLGNSNQQWIAYTSQNFSSALVSLSANPSTLGYLKLANSDLIGWRDTSNTTNYTLGDSGALDGNIPADCLEYTGAGLLAAAFISSTGTNTASATGTVRLASGDTVKFRNNANGADINGLSKNSSDVVTVGDAAGVAFAGSVQGNTAVVGNVSVTGNISATGTLTTSGNAIVPAIQFGGTTSGFPMLKQGTVFGQPGLLLRLADDSGYTGLWLKNLNINGVVSQLNGLTMTGQGVPGTYSIINLTGQTAAVGTTTIFTGAAVTASLYRVTWSAKITTAAGVSSTLGALTINYTDPDGVAIAVTCGAQIVAGTIATTSTANTTGTVLLGLPLLLNCQAGSTISYAFAYASNAANAMAYNLHIVLEKMN